MLLLCSSDGKLLFDRKDKEAASRLAGWHTEGVATKLRFSEVDSLVSSATSSLSSRAPAFHEIRACLYWFSCDGIPSIPASALLRRQGLPEQTS